LRPSHVFLIVFSRSNERRINIPYAVLLCLQPDDAPRINKLWEILDRENYSSDQITLNYSPHITLAIHDDTADPQVLMKMLSSITAHWKNISVSLQKIESIAPNVLWVAPVVTEELLQYFSKVHAALPTESLNPYYLPENYHPHVTLARDVKAAGQALTAVSKEWEPFETKLDRLQLIYFRPVRLIWDTPLSPG